MFFKTCEIAYTKDQGRFFCPTCKGLQTYDQKRLGRFFSFYFIPLIPLDRVSRHIECRQCKSTYGEDILTYDHEADQTKKPEEFQRAMKRVMVCMMLADGKIEPSEIDIIDRIYSQLFTSQLLEIDIMQEADYVKKDIPTALNEIREMVARLNDKDKDQVVEAACRVAAADGNFHFKEHALLENIRQAIQVSPGRVWEIMSGLPELR